MVFISADTASEYGEMSVTLKQYRSSHTMDFEFRGVMALSDEERKVLAEMERQLIGQTNDVVDFGVSEKANLTSFTVGVLVAALGLGVIVAGVVFQTPLVGVAGFGLMVAGVLLAMRRGPKKVASDSRKTESKRRSTLEERWERRIDGEL